MVQPPLSYLSVAQVNLPGKESFFWCFKLIRLIDFFKSVSWLCHFAFLPRVLSCSLCLISSYFFMCVTGFILFARYFGGRSTAKVYSFRSYPQAFQTETHMLVT